MRKLFFRPPSPLSPPTLTSLEEVSRIFKSHGRKEGRDLAKKKKKDEGKEMRRGMGSASRIYFCLSLSRMHTQISSLLHVCARKCYVTRAVRRAITMTHTHTFKNPKKNTHVRKNRQETKYLKCSRHTRNFPRRPPKTLLSHNFAIFGADAINALAPSCVFG